MPIAKSRWYPVMPGRPWYEQRVPKEGGKEMERIATYCHLGAKGASGAKSFRGRCRNHVTLLVMFNFNLFSYTLGVTFVVAACTSLSFVV